MRISPRGRCSTIPPRHSIQKAITNPSATAIRPAILDRTILLNLQELLGTPWPSSPSPHPLLRITAWQCCCVPGLPPKPPFFPEPPGLFGAHLDGRSDSRRTPSSVDSPPPSVSSAELLDFRTICHTPNRIGPIPTGPHEAENETSRRGNGGGTINHSSDEPESAKIPEAAERARDENKTAGNAECRKNDKLNTEQTESHEKKWGNSSP